LLGFKIGLATDLGEFVDQFNDLRIIFQPALKAVDLPGRIFALSTIGQPVVDPQPIPGRYHQPAFSSSLRCLLVVD